MLILIMFVTAIYVAANCLAGQFNCQELIPSISLMCGILCITSIITTIILFLIKTFCLIKKECYISKLSKEIVDDENAFDMILEIINECEKRLADEGQILEQIYVDLEEEEIRFVVLTYSSLYITAVKGILGFCPNKIYKTKYYVNGDLKK